VSPGGSLTITNLALKFIILKAFDVKYSQVSGGPGWLDTTGFNIVAKSEGNPSQSQMLAMLRTLLADRFQLKVHRETKEGNVYALVVAKNGPKLKEPTGDRSWVSLIRITPPDRPGLNYALQGRKTSMALFAKELCDQVGRPVLNRTGIQGEFDFRVDYSTDDNPETGPSIFAAMQEQLGLRLEATKGPLETLVVDHAEKPLLRDFQ
jgi:uncharacterized protein (TIGR03435 family)